MSLETVHILDSPAPCAGQIHAHIRGLVEALQALEVRCRIVAAEGDGRLTTLDGDDGTAPCDAASLDRADVIHVHGAGAAAAPPIQVRMGHKANHMVFCPHGDLLPSPWRRTGPIRKLFTWLDGAPRRYRRAAALHATTPAEAEYLTSARLNQRIEQLDVILLR